MGLFNSKNKKSRAEGARTIVAEGCKVTGEITELQGTLHIDGRIEGVIETEYDISIGSSGSVSGLVKAQNIVVSGLLEGKVACQSIEVLSSGKLMGEVISGEMKIESGGRFIGESRELTEGGLIVSFPENEQLPHSDTIESNTEKMALENQSEQNTKDNKKG